MALSRVESRDGTRLHVRVDGPDDAPPMLLVHGYPDTHAVYDRLVARLAPHRRVIRYDVRGAGGSDRPTAEGAYRLDRLVDDAEAVLDACAPRQRVHLVGHDWGSIQAFEVAYRLASRIERFTSLSGPCLDHIGAALRASDREARALVRDQLLRSWYIGVLANPALAARLVGTPAFAARFLEALRTEEGATDVAALSPTFSDDAVAGARLYADNVAARLRAPRARPIHVPVQLLVATRDRFVSPRIAEVLPRFAPDLRVERIDATHWCLLTHPDELATRIRSFGQVG